MSTQAAHNGSWVCQPNRHYRSRGLFFGDSPFSFADSVLLAQLSLSSLLTSLLQCLLTPLGESSFISQMLVGLALGPSFYGGDSPILEAIFPFKSFYVSETFAYFGCMVFMFLVGVKMDLSLIAKSGKKALVIGVLAFVTPMVFNFLLTTYLKSNVEMDANLKNFLTTIGAFHASSSFHVIACLLSDLKLLNSDIGRLALSSSMISGTLSWIGLVASFTMRQTSMQQQDVLPWMALCVVCMIILVVYILRPIMIWIMEQTNLSGRPIKETYVLSLFLMLLFCALFSEFVGQHFILGPMILGLAVPDGPPLGSALVDKLDSFVSSIMLPCFFVISGARMNLSMFDMRSASIIHLLAFTAFMGKLIGTMLPSLYCKMSLVDSLSLGLIMSAQGIADILGLQHGLLLYMIDQSSYSMTVVAMMVMTGTICPIVKILYNPSKRYRCSARRRTIEHTSANAELRLLLCIHHQDDTPSIINMLELSNPTIKSPICFYLIHLLQLTGRASPLLIHHHHLRQRGSKHYKLSDQIIKAFQIYQQFNYDKVIMNAFTSVSPYATMHDDVCMLALEKRVAMVIVPFHKRRTINGIVESINPIRGVNKNILSKAPCSVGILIDREMLPSTAASVSLMNRVDLYKVGMIFVEGPDDREALAYATRMAEHPMVALTVVRVIQPKRSSRHPADQDLDAEMINEFKLIMETSVLKHCTYEEEMASDCVGLINVIRTMEHDYDMILVGRRHDGDSALFVGLHEWNEFPELGYIGDMLASSDSTGAVAVLVVQQQTIGGDQEFLDDFRCLMEESFSVDIRPLNLPTAWPQNLRLTDPFLSFFFFFFFFLLIKRLESFRQNF
ncbi:LOW QUALITY PROTEIN: cation/H(+) antiporter 15-like [Benincasa hispida]|uniref:LOW QUALITY PROTEIN: cation/H(+) antiporter 15-like n=1 Tax=Benincasa hispida TaxID=102211 RepID=UPI0019029F9B|nr:LOW QUALITY PROTEIN: cation/H(+) antiporter 15-like [Benincasa hispida]